MRIRAHIALWVISFLFAACAPISQLPQVDEEAAKREAHLQRELVVRQQLDHNRQLVRVTFPILLHNSEICAEQQKTKLDFGLKLANRHYFAEDYRDAAESALGFGDVMKVLTVAPNSPAAIAGLREGDTVIRMNGWEIPLGEEAFEALLEKYKAAIRESEEITLTIMREGKELPIRMTGVTACDYPYSIAHDPNVNAFADGEKIIINSGMMDFIRSDEELATVVGHEVAHNLMEHISKKTGNAMIGVVFDILFAGFGVNTGGAFQNMGATAYSQNFEAEADYVGLYLTSRGGFDISKSPSFWRRMGVKHPGSIKSNHAASHPATPHRFIALEKTIAEINAKKAQGLPLVPEKERPQSPPATVESSTDQQ